MPDLLASPNHLYDTEYRVRHEDGRWVDVWERGCLIRDHNGQVLRIVGSTADITSRKRAETALRGTEERLRLALQSAELGTWDFNPITGELTWDEGCKAMFGLPPDAAVDYDTFLAGLHPDDRDRTHQVVLGALNPVSGGEYDIEYRTIGLTNRVERWIAAKGKAFFSETGEAIRFIGTVLNITDRQRIEAEREQLLAREQASREQAETANRIKDEFLAVLSHELRTPLNPILGWSRLLRHGKLDAAKTAHALETIERNAKLQTQLIEDLLDVSRILRGKLSLNVIPVNLASTIESAMETVRLAAEAKAIEIQTVFDPTVGQILGDSARFQQVVWNLLSNAVKFTPAGGRVNIRLERMGSQAQIQVSDTGKGIPPDFLPYVFEYFRQADGTTTRTFGGLGLGLAIVRHLVELHGGTVQAESQGEGQGATFTVRLPMMKVDGGIMKDEAPVLVTSSPQPLMGIRVLLVDDEADARDLVAFILELAGASVTSVASAIAALEALVQTQPDVLVSDIGMPEMDGYMLIRQVRAMPQGQQILAIALTAYAGESDYRQALAAGFQQHISKPVEPAQLVEAIACACFASANSSEHPQ
jgi:signal transduction histidine kinase/ActR/RegA family two-component response regulator